MVGASAVGMGAEGENPETCEASAMTGVGVTVRTNDIGETIPRRWRDGVTTPSLLLRNRCADVPRPSAPSTGGLRSRLRDGLETGKAELGVIQITPLGARRRGD